MSFTSMVAKLNNNSCKKFEYTVTMDAKDVQLVVDALKNNTSCVEVVLANTGINSTGGILFAEIISQNSTIKKLDLGYNSIEGSGIAAIGAAIARNSTLSEVKLHRQEKEMGPIAEEKLCGLWETNVTLTRLYATLHSRKFNGDNTRGEVRNKEISRRKEAGRDWIDLDPARKEEFKKIQEEERKQRAVEEALSNAPITSRIESTGGPYTMKQLTCLIDYLPADVPKDAKETFLSDDDFQEVFGTDKATFAALPKWKRTNIKKDKKLK